MRTRSVAIVTALLTMMGSALFAVPSDAGASLQASKSPVKVLVVGSEGVSFASQWEPVVADKAAAKFMNAHGGIGGHPVDVISCNDQNNPNLDAQCAQQAVSDHVVAVVGSFALADGSSIAPVLQQAGIANIGPSALSTADFTNPDIYQYSATTLGLFIGLGDYFTSKGCKGAVAVRDDIAAAAGAAQLFDAKARQVLIPANTTDFSPLAQSATSTNPGCVGMLVDQSETEQFLSALHQQGTNLSTSMTGTGYDDDPETSVSKNPTINEGIYVTSAFPARSSSVLKPFMQQMQAEDPSHNTPRDDHALNAWLGMQLLKQVSQNLPTINAQTVHAALQSAKNVNIANVVKNYTPAATGPASTFPRISEPTIYVLRDVNGKYVAVTKIPNMFATSS